MNKIDITKWIIKDLRKYSYSFQIEEYVIEMIKLRALQPGETLPSIREVASVNNINKNTVHLAFNKLIAKGWLTYTHGARTKVSFNYPGVLNTSNMNTHVGLPEYLHLDVERIKNIWTSPVQDFITVGTQILDEICSPEKAISRYAQKYREQGIESSLVHNNMSVDNSSILIAPVLEHLNLTRGFQTLAGNLHIVKGRSESIKNIFHILFSPGDIVINTSPSDLLINWILKEASIKSINIDLTSDNFIKTLKSNTLKKQVKAIYIRPGCNYPKGKTLDIDTCKELIDLAQRHRFLIIEEDDDHEFWHGAIPFKPLITYPNNGHIIYAGALSRLSPYLQSLRTVVAPSEIIEFIKKMPLSIYEYRDIPEELAIAHMLRNGELATFSRHARKLKQKDLASMHKIFQTHLIEYMEYELPEAGLSVWLEFNKKINLRKILNHLSRSGIQVPLFPEKQRHLPIIYNMRLDFSHYQEQECKQAAIMIEKIYKRLLVTFLILFHHESIALMVDI